MRNDENLHYQTATTLIAALANKEISSLELVKKTISRIECLDKKINAVVVKNFEQALVSAKAADKAIARHKQLPLLGLPITIKESFNVTGLPTTWGNSVYKNWRPNQDALVVERLKNAGAIIIGKTNVPFMLNDWQAYNAIYGTTNNPWDLSRTPGGSSGGSAAALAAGFTALELGSDLAGSLRVPANFCGVFAHKPSIHLIPLRGTTPPKTPPSPNPIANLMVAGPLARTAQDLALALDVLAGPDELWDGKAYKLALPTPRHKDLSHFRVLVIQDHPLCATSTEVEQSINNLVASLIKHNVQVSTYTQAMPDLGEITRTYLSLFSAFIGANMPIEKYQSMTANAKTLDNDDVGIEASIARGLSSSYRHWLMATRSQNKLRQAFRSLFHNFDVVICPVTPTPAYPHNHSNPGNRQIEIDGSLYPYSDQFSWVSIATLFGLPATVVPIDYTENGLPIGIQVIGDYLEDYTTIEFASLLEQAFGGFSIPPL
ncbi:MAG: amidase [Pseudomonadota bacterium]